MSLHGITSSISQTGLLPQVAFGGSAKKKSSNANAADSDASSIGQIPVGTGQNLLANALQALEQAISAQTGTATPTASGTTGATGSGSTSAVSAASAQASTQASAASDTSGPSTAASGGTAGASSKVALELQGFLHSLFSALRQDSPSSAASATTASPASATSAAATASATTSSSAGAGQYQGSLVSSLQTLIQQLGGSGSNTPAATNLSKSFAGLVQGSSASTAGTGAATASGGTAASTAATAQLTNFLNGLLQKIQANGSQAPTLLGSHVNANV